MTRTNVVAAVLALILAGLILAACGGAPQTAAEQPETISVSGAFALYPLMVQWADEYQKLHPNVTIDVSAGGAGKGMADTLSGAVDIGMVSREVKPEEVSKGAFVLGVARDAVFPVVNANNPVLVELMKSGVSKQSFAGVFITGNVTTWGQLNGDPSNTTAIHVYTRSDSAGAADMWSAFLGGKGQDDLKGIGVSGDPGITDAVAKDTLGIGYKNLNYAFDPTTSQPVKGIAVIPVDANGNGQADPQEVLDTRAKAMDAVAGGQYPAPPARVLNLVTKGTPKGAVKDFLHWILTDGQQFLNSAGYIALPADQLAAELAMFP